MKIEEAIEHLRDINTVAKTRHMMRDIDGDLEDGEVQLYRERFEAVKMGMAALEKQIPKEPKIYCADSKFRHYECPSCSRLYWERSDYCDCCGQALKWD